MFWRPEPRIVARVFLALITVVNVRMIGPDGPDQGGPDGADQAG